MDTDIDNTLFDLLDAKNQLSEVADRFASCHSHVVMLTERDVGMAIEMEDNVSSYSVKVTSTATAIEKVCGTYTRADSEQLASDLHTYYAIVIQVCNQIIKRSKQHPVMQILSFINPFSASLKRLLAKESHFAMTVNKQIPRVSDHINRNVKNMLPHVIKDNAEILRKITNRGTYLAELITGQAIQSSDLMYCALLHASKEGCVDLVARLLKIGANVNRTVHGTVPLLASDEDHQWYRANRQFVTADGIKMIGEPGRTALHAALEEQHPKVVERLLAANANANAERYRHIPCGDRYPNQTALQAAAEAGHLEVVEQLLAAGAHVNAPAGGWAFQLKE